MTPTSMMTTSAATSRPAITSSTRINGRSRLAATAAAVPRRMASTLRLETLSIVTAPIGGCATARCRLAVGGSDQDAGDVLKAGPGIGAQFVFPLLVETG